MAKLPERRSPKGLACAARAATRNARSAGQVAQPAVPAPPLALPAPKLEELCFKSPSVNARAARKRRAAEEKAELATNMAHFKKKPNPDLLSPDTVAQFVAIKDSLSPGGQRDVGMTLKRHFTRSQLGAHHMHHRPAATHRRRPDRAVTDPRCTAPSSPQRAHCPPLQHCTDHV